MFCPICGANLKEGSIFCDSCGNKVATSNTVAPQPEAQVFDNQPPEPIVPNVGTTPNFAPVPPVSYPPVAVQPKMKKGKYIKNSGSKTVKTLSWVVWPLLLILVVVLGLGAYRIQGAGLTEIPAVAMIVPEDSLELEDVTNEAIDLLDEAEETLDDVKDELSSEEYDLIKGFIADAKKLAKTPSIANVKNVLNRFDEVTKTADKYVDNENMTQIKNQIDSIDVVNELADTMYIIDIAVYIVLGFAGFIALLMLLATALKSGGLTIFCVILSAPLLYFIAGPVYCVIAAIIYVALFVMFTIINNEYKKYRKGI